MKTEIILRMEMIGRVVLGLRTLRLATPGSHLEACHAELELIAEELRAAAAGQEAAFRGFRQDAVRRAAASASLQEWMADIARVARSLPFAQYGAVAEYFRMPRSQSYQAQQSSALGFIKALRLMPEVFGPRGFDEAFIEEGETMLAEIETANRAKISNVSTRIAETFTLMLRSSRGLAVVREIDAILQRKLRSNPALLAEWNSVRRVHRLWKKKPAALPSPAPATANQVEAASRTKPERSDGKPASRTNCRTGISTVLTCDSDSDARIRTESESAQCR